MTWGGKHAHLVVEPALRVEVVEVRLVRLSAPEVEVRDLEVAPEMAAVVRLAVVVGHVVHRVVFGEVFGVQFDKICNHSRG